MSLVIGLLVGLAVGAVATLGALRATGGSRLDAARRTRDQLLDDARREAEATRREAQIEAREASLRARAEVDREADVRALQEELKHAREDALAELEHVSGLTVADAKSRLLARSEELIRHE